MKTVCLIPARLDSVRLPNKMLQLINGKPLIVRTFEAVEETNVFDETWVATDSKEIAEVLEKSGAKVFMSSSSHESGTDRIAELAQTIDADVVVNVQGDEPFISAGPLKKLVEAFTDDAVEVASLMREEISLENYLNPNVVKVVTDLTGHALYFSRAPLPFVRDNQKPERFYAHVGVYAFKKDALLRFTMLPQTPLEKNEKLEQLRMLENGMRIKMVLTDFKGLGIDTLEDLKKAEQILNAIT